MFEAAELGRKIPKDAYQKQVPELRAGLLEAQRALREAKVPVIVVISGADGAGKDERSTAWSSGSIPVAWRRTSSGR